MSDEFKISFGALVKGQLYPITSIERTESTFYGKKSQGLKVTVLDDELELTTYLPKKLVESTTDLDVQRIKAAALTPQKESVCYYGCVSSSQTTSFVGRIHKYNEDVDRKLLRNMELLMSKYGAKVKREDDDDDSQSPSKKAKQC